MYNNDPRNPSNHSGTVSCALCSEEYRDEETHYCKEVLIYDDIDNVDVEGINMDDYPKFTDAFIVSADYQGDEMTEEQLDQLNEDSDFVYNAVMNHIY